MAGRDRIYVAYLNYSECKTGPIYRAETLQGKHGRQHSKHQSPGQRVPLRAAFPTSPRGISMAPLGFSGRGNGACLHDARRGEDRAHTQGVSDLPATGQGLAHALSILILFCRQ